LRHEASIAAEALLLAAEISIMSAVLSRVASTAHPEKQPAWETFQQHAVAAGASATPTIMITLRLNPKPRPLKTSIGLTQKLYDYNLNELLFMYIPSQMNQI